MSTKILSCNSNRPLADAISKYMELPLTKADVRRFSDMEVFVEIQENVRGEDVFIIQSTSSPTNDNLMELLVALDALKRGSANRITAVIPYYGYARQDKRFSAGESVSAKTVAEVVSKYCDGIAILDLHAPEVLEGMDVPIEFVSSMPEIADSLQKGVSPDFILSPDKGAISRATEVASLIGCEFSYLEKTRIDAHTIEHTPKDLDVSGKVVAIVDDMISTGGTICRASDALRRQGATEVHAACTHGLFTGGALSRLANHVDGVYTTDSLPNPRASVSAAPALARGLSSLMEKVTHNG